MNEPILDFNTMIELTDRELCSVIQGLRAQVAQRLYWMIAPHHPIRTWDLSDEQEVLSPMAQAYAKALMLARENPRIVSEFKEAFALSDAAWELLDQIETAGSWDEIPLHGHSPLRCELCDELSTAG